MSWTFEAFVAQPKAELHVHLEGAIRPSTLRALAAELGDHPFAHLSDAALQARFQTTSFAGFLDNFILGYRVLRTAAHFQRVTEELCADLAAQGVCAAQILYAPGVYVQRLGMDLAHIHRGIQAGLSHWPQLQVCFILDTVLNLGVPFMETTLDLVLADRPEFLGGFSVGGGDPELDFHAVVPLFHKAARAGLFGVAHAGEVDGPRNIDILLQETDVVRIAHACAAAESPETLAALARRQTLIDVCLSSNLRTGVVADLSQHPVHTFLRHKIPFTLSTDDPTYFGTTLYREYQLAAEHGVAPDSLKESMRRSLDAFSART